MRKKKLTEKLYSAIDLHDRRGVRSQLRVAIIPWNGRPKIHIREFYPQASGEYKPGRGIALNTDVLEQVIYGLQLALDDLSAGLFDESSEENSESDDE